MSPTWIYRLSPEVYLRRPPELFPEWRLEDVLQRKAEQGVKIHIIVYKEVPDTSSIDSEHTKVCTRYLT